MLSQCMELRSSVIARVGSFAPMSQSLAAEWRLHQGRTVGSLARRALTQGRSVVGQPVAGAQVVLVLLASRLGMLVPTSSTRMHHSLRLSQGRQQGLDQWRQWRLDQANRGIDQDAILSGAYGSYSNSTMGLWGWSPPANAFLASGPPKVRARASRVSRSRSGLSSRRSSLETSWIS